MPQLEEVKTLWLVTIVAICKRTQFEVELLCQTVHYEVSRRHRPTFVPTVNAIRIRRAVIKRNVGISAVIFTNLHDACATGHSSRYS
jgi:hypothetical protein